VAQLSLLDQILAQAGAALEQNRLADAERLAKTALKIGPNHFLSSYIMGLALAGQSKFQQAVTHLIKAEKLNTRDHSVQSNVARVLMDCGELKRSIPYHQKSLALSPNNINSLLNYGTSLLGLGDHEKALNIFDRMLVISPNNFSALINKSIALKELKRYPDLIHVLNQLLEVDHNFAKGWNELGSTYREVGRYQESISALGNAVLADPDYAEAHFNLGLALEKAGLYTEALSSYDRVIELGAEELAGPSLWLNRGIVFNSLKSYDNALASYKKVIDNYPGHAIAHSNSAYTLNQIGRHNEALEHCEIALNLNQSADKNLYLNSADTYLNQAVAYTNLNQLQLAKSAYLEALKINPDHAESHVNLMYLYMGEFDFVRGWEAYEWRWLKKSANTIPLVTSKPTWDGQKRSNRLFIWAEQGIGDQILYSSILTELNEYPQKIALSVEKKLLPLFKRSFPKFEIYDKNEPPSDYEYDEQIPIASIAKYFRGRLDFFPKYVKPYLVDDSNHTRMISTSLVNSVRKVCGISWKSSAKDIGEKKSVPLIIFEPILRNKTLDFVSLQYGDVADEVNMVNHLLGVDLKVLDELNLFDSIDDVASLVQACDVIVTTSNSTAHIAGGFGKEVLLLIASTDDSIWYWHSLNGKSIWYPSITVLSKAALGDWANVITEANFLLGKICDE